MLQPHIRFCAGTSLACALLLTCLPSEAAITAAIRLTGGGTSGQAFNVEFLQDTIITASPGSSFGGYYFGITIPDVFSQSDSYSNYDSTTSAAPPFEYKEQSGGPTLNFANAGISTAGNDLNLYFFGNGYPEILIQNEGSFTIKAGTVTRNSLSGNNVLVDPGATYQITTGNFYSFSEVYSTYSPSSGSLSTVPEPSTFILGVVGLALTFRRRRIA